VPAALPPSIRTGKPRDPVPCQLLGQLTTDRAWTGRGIGTGLLKHALARNVTAAGLIGGQALVVRAVDTDVATIWRRGGFLPPRDDPFVLIRPIADIAASLKEAKS
jgi:GNAT superfamily N-acetyltransferase